MSLLSRFARPKDDTAATAAVSSECAHHELAPRWDSAADMGKKDKITSFTCGSCKQSFSPEEAERLALV